MSTIKVTVGIPAYNEEGNIRSLLQQVIAQVEIKFSINKILVVSDASTDKTVDEICAVNDPRIVLINSPIRQGQAGSQNLILDVFEGDILVLLNADIRLSDKSFIQKLIRPLMSDPHIGLTCAAVYPEAANTFISKVLAAGMNFRRDLFEHWRKGQNIMTCHGASRAMSAKFAGSFRWDNYVAEDAYCYLQCKKSGFKYKYVENAKLYLAVPSNLRDHLLQSRRFKASKEEIIQNLGELAEQEYKTPILLVLTNTISAWLKEPMYFTTYFLISIISSLMTEQENSLLWEPAISTKRLKNYE